MENPVIVGHSFGGMVSLITASKYSSEMAGLLLVDFVVYKPEIMNGMRAEHQPDHPGSYKIGKNCWTGSD